MSNTQLPLATNGATATADSSMGAIVWSEPARQRVFEAWLAGLAQRYPLQTESLRLASADASFRRYFRLDARAPGSGATSWIIMDAPPAHENCQPFVTVAALMRAAGLRVPQVLEWESQHGFLLLTDLGQQTLLDVIDPAQPQANLALYQQATDALLAWQLASRPGLLPVYDAALLQRELALFTEWYVARHRGYTLSAAQQATLEQAFALIVQHNLTSASVFVHRDFMPRNLMLPTTPAAAPAAAVGVLDFQDAVYGPISYDIASLMRDAFLSWDEDFVLDVTVRYWEKARKAGLPVAADFGDFYRAVEWMGLQRHFKVAGIFARLTLRDGKPRYLADTPRFIGYIHATCTRYRALGPLLKLVEQIEDIHSASGYAFGRV